MRYASFLCAVIAVTLLATETWACNRVQAVAVVQQQVAVQPYAGCGTCAAPAVGFAPQVTYAAPQVALVPQMSYAQVQAFAVAQPVVVHQRAAFGGYGGGGFGARGSRGGFGARAGGSIGGAGGLIDDLLPAAGAVGGAIIGGPVGAGIGAFVGDRLRR